MGWSLMPSVFWYAVAAVVGACFGSFSNVLVYRLPRNLSVVGPRSYCPSCEKTVAWYDNIPLLSWIILRGRCRHCAAPISPRYLLLEMAGILCALTGFWRFGVTPHGAGVALYLLLLVNIAVIDWQHMIIPHTLTITGMVAGLGLSFFTPIGPVNSLQGLLMGGGIILAVSYGYKLVRGVIGMGGGDVMLMGMVGAFQGPYGVLAVLFGGALFGSLYAVTAMRGKPAGAAKLPFGTFLAAAALVVLLAGERLWQVYMGLF